MVKKETIIEFMGALKEEYNRDVDFKEASIILNDLVSYFDLLAKIDHVQDEVKNDIMYEPD
jgi:hypothetical protein